MRGLDGKVAIVAGGGGGIGAAACRRLAQSGAVVVVGDVMADAATAVADELLADGATASSAPFDLADQASCSALVAHAVDEHGRVDALYNVGADLSAETLGRDVDLLDCPDEVWHRTLDVNLVGYARTIRAVLPRFLDQGGGAIVNTLTGLFFYGDTGRPAYTSSKGGVLSLTRHVAARWGKDGVRCNAVAPGLVMTETASARTTAEEQQRILAGNRTTRLGVPEDIASAVAFLLSDEAAWMNGEHLVVNGGRVG